MLCTLVTDLFDKLDTGLKIETEIDKFPLDSFSLVFFLFENEHVMIEELLELFVHKIDPQLFKGVELKLKVVKF